MKCKNVLIIIMSLTVGLVGCSMSDTTQTPDTEIATEDVSATETEETTEEITAEDTETEDTSEEDVTEEESAATITVSYETREEDRTDDDGNILVKISYQRPTVTVEGKEDISALIKQEFDSDEEAFMIRGDELARDSYYEPVDDSMQSYSSISVTYTDKRLDRAVISFERLDYTYYVGTPHGQPFFSGLNFDTQTGTILHLEDITEDKEEFLAAAKDYILMLCESDEFKDRLNPGYEERVDGLLQEDLWYFDEQGITFFANVYEMAPYSEGVLYFTIPYNDLNSVKAEYLK